MDGWTTSAPSVDDEETKESGKKTTHMYVTQSTRSQGASITRYIERGVRPPTPPTPRKVAAKPSQSRAVPKRITTGDLFASSDEENTSSRTNNEPSQWGQPLRGTVLTITHHIQKKARESHEEQELGQGRPTGKTFFEYHRLWHPISYFEATIYKFFETTAEKFHSNLVNLQVPKLKFGRILVAVDHFVTLAAIHYRIHRFNKPGLHPGHPDSYELEDDPRQVPLGEVLLALSPKPVQIHEDYLHGLIVYGDRATNREGRDVPVSDFQVSAKLVTLALSFLAHIGCITVGYGEYSSDRESWEPIERVSKDYGVLLAELHYFALTFVPNSGHDLLQGQRTFYFSVPHEYDYAWTALLRQVIARESLGGGYYEAGFEYSYTRGGRLYTWDVDSEPYWCPVLRKDFEG